MDQPYFSHVSSDRGGGRGGGGFSDAVQYNQPNTYPAFPLLLGSGHIPETLLYWHNDPNPQPEIVPISHPAFPLSQENPPQQQQQQQGSSNEQRKHKRTRSGCLTCRARRIKCDEGRPVCERCRKGNRPCEYANSSAKSSSRMNKTRRNSSHESISSDEEQTGGLDVIPDEDETADIPSSLPSSKMSKASTQSPGSGRTNTNPRPRTTSEASSASKSKSLSPASDLVSSSQSSSISSLNFQLRTALTQRPVRDLPEIFRHRRLKDDIRFFLKYHQEKINHNHYLMNYECDTFVRGTLLDLALEYEPLLYAMVGFAAYHYTLQNPQGKIYDFLKYYDQSLQLLRKSLASRVKHTEAMLATILQLSTFEETIGDFMNLIDHHQAADALVHELLTPQSIAKHKNHRCLFVWHARYDLMACLFAGNEAIMGREWYMSLSEHDTAQAAQSPDDVMKQLRMITSRSRVSAMEFASLFAQLARKVISPDEFEERFDILVKSVEDVRHGLERYDDSDEIITPRPAVPLQGPEDVLDTDMVCRFYRGSKYFLNFLWTDLLAAELMFKYQSHIMTGRPDGAELQNIALQMCHNAESISRWPEAEVGTNIAGHNWMILMTLFLPQEPKYEMWGRRMFAMIEVNGYIHAPRVRRALAEVWNDPSVEDWWDPTDEGCPNIIKEIRALTEERTTNPRDNYREDVRDLKSLFENMHLRNSASSTPPDQTNQ